MDDELLFGFRKTQDPRARSAEECFRLAYETQMQGKLEEAADLYKKSIALWPTAEAHTFLGWTYSF